MNYLAKNLFFLRKYFKFTQAEMYAHIDVTRVTWSNYENGVTEPDIDKLLNISRLFNVSIDDIISVEISENVHLIKKTGQKNSTEIVHPNVHPNVHPMENSMVNEDEVPYENALKREVDLLILRQLNSIAADVAEIKGKLPQ